MYHCLMLLIRYPALSRSLDERILRKRTASPPSPPYSMRSFVHIQRIAFPQRHLSECALYAQDERSAMSMLL